MKTRIKYLSKTRKMYRLIEELIVIWSNCHVLMSMLSEIKHQRENE